MAFAQLRQALLQGPVAGMRRVVGFERSARIAGGGDPAQHLVDRRQRQLRGHERRKAGKIDARPAGVAGVADRGKGELHVGFRPLRGRRILAQAPVGQGVIGGIEAVLVGCPQAFHRAGRGGRPGAVPGPDQRALGFRIIGGERLAVLAAHAHLAHGGIVREKSRDGHAEDIRLHQGGHGRRIGERNIDGGGRLQIGRIDGDGGRFDRRDRVGGHAPRRGRLNDDVVE